MRVRLLDLGSVPYVESQTIYHGVAYAMGEDSPNTVSLMSPASPYVCIGFHQELEKEIDVDYCKARDLPILRREVGGGAVYLDGGQLFLHFIFHRGDLPRKVEELYALFIRPLVGTYRAFGVEAEHRPLNDIVVRGRKIGGTGIASIGQAVVVAGSLMFDFDSQTMAGALKVSSEKMRDKVYQSLQEYMTTVARELGAPPPSQEVKRALIANVGQSLGVELEPGDLTAAEKQTIRRLNRRFLSKRWLHQKGGLRGRGITIGAGVSVAETEYKAPGGLIRLTARLNDGTIEDLSISGDFTFHPAAALARLEASLRGRRLEERSLAAAVGGFYRSNAVQAPGLDPEHVAHALSLLGDPGRQAAS
ncbi:MAG: lipoate--protein ligase family protein [Chloroflexota bacterium]|nr:lipoate--protein ligase family protein [Chloroflexota bacterium]